LPGSAEAAECHHPQEGLDRLEIHHLSLPHVDNFILSKLIRK